MPLFGAAFAAPNKGTTILYYFLVLISPLSQSSISEIVSEHDQEIPQSQTADNPVASRGRATQPS